MTGVSWVLLALTGSSAATDLWRGRIYNVVVVPALALGLVLAGVPACGGSPAILGERATMMLFVLALCLPFWMCLPGSIGGGDIKLFLAMAVLLPGSAFLILLFVSLAGACVVSMLRNMLLVRGRAPHVVAQMAATRSRDGRMRIGPAVFCATLLYVGGFYG